MLAPPVAHASVAAGVTRAPVTIAQTVKWLRATGDGRARAILVRAPGHWSVTSISNTGAIDTPVAVRLPSRTSSVESTIAADGSTSFAAWAPTAHDRHSGRTRWIDVSPTGVQTGTPTSVGLPNADLPTQIAVGPTGAAAVVSNETTTGGSNPVLVFKPAGSSSFGRAITLGPSFRHGQRGVMSYGYGVALGPGGGGFVYAAHLATPLSPEPTFRRISPQGVLGPAIPLPVGRHFAVVDDAEIAPDGTIAVVLDAIDMPTARSGGAFTDQIEATTLGPTADAFTAPQNLGFLEDGGGNPNDLSIAVDANDQAVVLAGTDARTGIRVFDGPVTALKPAPSLVSPFATDAHLASAPDGTITATWLSGPRGQSGDPAMTATRPPGGAFGPARPLVPSGMPKHLRLMFPEPVVLNDGTVVYALSLDRGTAVGALAP